MELKDQKTRGNAISDTYQYEPNDWGFPSKSDPSPGLEAANKFLRSKLQLLQKDLDKALSDKSSKENKILSLVDTIKSLEEEIKKSKKMTSNQQSQMQKVEKVLEDTKKKLVDSENEVLSLKKVSFSKPER